MALDAIQFSKLRKPEALAKATVALHEFFDDTQSRKPKGAAICCRSFQNVHHKLSPLNLFEERKIKTVSYDISIGLSFLALRGEKGDYTVGFEILSNIEFLSTVHGPLTWSLGGAFT